MTRKWQNLIHKKCPNCDLRLEETKTHWICPSYKNDTTKCFIISKEKSVSYMTDPSHPANKHLSKHERDTLQEALINIGLISQDDTK